MGQDAGLKCRLRANPEVLQAPCRMSGESDTRYRQSKCSDGNLEELRRHCIPNFHCKSLPTRSRNTNAEDSVEGKRGSMYQSSSEISRIRRLQEGRRKIDSAFDGDACLSLEIVDSSSHPSTSGGGAYLSSHQNWRDNNSKLGHRPRLDCTLLKDDAGDDFLGISLEEEITIGPCRNAAAHLLDGELGEVTEANCQHKISVCPSESNRGGRERDSVSNLPKSMSGTRPSESVHHGVENSTQARSSPLKKILDPIMKYKSLRSPSLVQKEGPNCVSTPVSRKKCVSHKSLLGDLSRTEHPLDCQPNGEIQCMTAALSPAHLQAVLRLDARNGIPVFEFRVEGRDESVSARSWKTGNELSWIYTFHGGGKRASAAGRASKDGRWCSPPIVGQLQVSSRLCSQVGKDGVLNNSVITEFVLYDVAHARRSSAAEEKTQRTETTQQSLCSVANKSISGESPQLINLMDRQNNARSNSEEVSTSCPWSEEDLYPHLEIAATVIQIPFNKDESKELKNGSSPGTINVIAPSGLHGSAGDNEAGPSSLLDRWRYGGGCDCGGWDMACPIVVLGNAYDNTWSDSGTKESKHPMELLVQGSKEELPALSMKANGKGQLLVDFHARLSAIQAFSVCISLLHCSEDFSVAMSIEKEGKHKLFSSSLKMLLEEEVRHLIEAVTGTAQEKKPRTRRERAPPSLVLDPPFSPMGRV